MPYKHLILVVSGIVVLGLSTVLKLWPYGMHRTFSQHVARHKSGILYYIALFATILPLLLVFIFKWFIPTFHPSALFGFFIILASISHFACTLVPETGGRKTTIHQLLAYLSADCLLPATLIVALTSSVSLIGRMAAIIASSIMAIIIILFVKSYVKNKGEHQYLLALQAAYFALFFITLVIATYTK